VPAPGGARGDLHVTVTVALPSATTRGCAARCWKLEKALAPARVTP
jgi:hypothetical protein